MVIIRWTMILARVLAPLLASERAASARSLPPYPRWLVFAPKNPPWGASPPFSSSARNPAGPSSTKAAAHTLVLLFNT